MTRKLPKVLPAGEFDELLHYATLQRRRGRTALREVVALLLLHDAGCRVSEACDMKRTDIDQDLVRIVDGKGGKDRTVGTSPRLWAAVEKWNEARRDDSELLLATVTGKPVDRFHYNRYLHRIGWQVLNHHVFPHMLRHTVATELACRQGVPLPVVQRFLGHSDLSVTAVYLHVEDVEVQALAARFG